METLIQNIVAELKTVAGVRAIVLGGSRARGTHTDSSDIDLGIYYDPRHGLDLEALGNVATRLDDRHQTDLLTGLGGWGPWINGGGWLHIQSVPVDFLYKDLAQIGAIIDACLRGQVEIFYQPGHPHGFVSYIYLSEIAVCQPLWDPDGVIAHLKSKVLPYPVALQKAILEKFAWEMDFAIGNAKKGVDRADVTYAAGCCFRSVMCLLQVLFALNQEYWLNEKGAVAIANRFPRKPAELQNRVQEVFNVLQATPEAINRSISLLTELSADVNALLQG